MLGGEMGVWPAFGPHALTAHMRALFAVVHEDDVGVFAGFNTQWSAAFMPLVVSGFAPLLINWVFVETVEGTRLKNWLPANFVHNEGMSVELNKRQGLCAHAVVIDDENAKNEIRRAMKKITRTPLSLISIKGKGKSYFI